MLVLTRKEKEKIYFGGNIVITVVQMMGNKVRIGVEAPSSVSIDRSEISDKKKNVAQIYVGTNVLSNIG